MLQSGEEPPGLWVSFGCSPLLMTTVGFLPNMAIVRDKRVSDPQWMLAWDAGVSLQARQAVLSVKPFERGALKRLNQQL